MEMHCDGERYWTERFENVDDGCAGFRLYRESRVGVVIAGEVIYWDATGGFTIETFGRILQVEVARAAMTEAEQKIRTR